MSPIRLRRDGDYILVEVEWGEGTWVEVIREWYDGQFCHIVERGGIETAIRKYADALPNYENRCEVCKFRSTEYYSVACAHPDRAHTIVSRETDLNWKGKCGPTFSNFVADNP